MRKFFLLFFVFLLCACKQHGPHYNGYFDADFTYLSSDFAGRLKQLFIKRGEAVAKSTLLFKVERTSETYGMRISRLNKKKSLLTAICDVLLSKIDSKIANMEKL